MCGGSEVARGRRSQRTRSATWSLVFGALGAVATALTPVFAQADGAGTEAAYPLDTIPRTSPRGAQMPCSSRGLVRYEGDIIRYVRPAQVHPAFVERLRRMERVVHSTAVEFYGRAPRRLLHMGTFNCRRIRAYPDLISEHALGNAIDVEGFEFGPLPRGVAAQQGAPASPFKIRLLSHWDSRRPTDQLHRNFLRTLARRIIDEPDLFRVALGPAWPGHKNHFHFDCAPYRLVEIF